MKNEVRPQSPWASVLKFVGVLFLLLFIIGLFVPSPGNDCIGRIKIAGEITYDGSSGVFGDPSANTPGEIADLLKEAKEKENIKAVLFEVNSPGGSAAASKEIFDSISDFEKPNLAYMTEVAASGGYYVAASTDYIIANPNAITGSIGARATFLNYEGLFEKIGLREETIKSGELKDIGSGTRNLTEEERKLLQALIDETLQNFRRDVEIGRKGKLNYNIYQEALDARILTASQARRAGLIDEIGNYKRVEEKANEMIKQTLKKEDAAKFKPLEFCDLNSKGGFDLFSDLSSNFGVGFAKGFVAGVREQNRGVEFK